MASLIYTIVLFFKYKEELMKDFEARILKHFADGTLKAIIETVFELDQVADAHRLMESNKNIGKILLKIAGDEDKSEEVKTDL